MTSGLLVSQTTKIILHKKVLWAPTVENQSKFKAFRNLYNKLVRASKRSFYCESLHAARKNPKKNLGFNKQCP
jgi:hypothetical protein